MAWSNPAVGRISSPYGARPSMVTTSGKTTTSFHAGVDVAGDVGVPVYAAAAGRVIFAGVAGHDALTAGRSGLAVVIRHPSGQDTYYGHLNIISVRVGQDVAAAQRIGDVGATGNVTGPHLHFEIRPKAGVALTTDPASFLGARGVRIGADVPLPASRDTQRVELVKVDGDFGPKTITALQRELGGVGEDVGVVDGIFGPRTIRAYQRWLTRCAFYAGAHDGIMGRMSVMSEQRWLRSHGLYPYGIDGARGARTVAALQAALNRGAIG